MKTTFPTTTRRPRWLAGVLTAAAMIGPAAAAQDPSPSDAPPRPLGQSYRRVDVPADRPEVWPTGGDRYLPVESDQLQRLLKAPTAPGRQAASLHLEARWSQNSLVGEGRLRVDSASFVPWPPSLPPDSQTPAPPSPTASRRPAAALQIVDPVWRATGDRGALGWWPIDGGRGVHGLASPAPGVLEFGFRSSPVDRRGPSAEFTLTLPKALRRTLAITAPPWLRFSGPGLIADPLGPAAEKPAADGPAAEKPAADDPPAENQPAGRWQIAAPPGDTLTLVVEDTRPRRSSVAAPFTAAERTRLEIQPDAIAVTARIKLASAGPLPSPFRVATLDGLLLQSAKIDGAPATITPINADPASVPSVQIALPPGPRPREATLTLRGVAPIRLDENFPSPRPQLPDAEWTEGVLTASLQPGLRLIDAFVDREAAPAPTPGGLVEGASTLAYRLLGPEGRVWLRVAPRRERTLVQAQRDIRLDAEADQATIQLTVESTSGPKPTTLDWLLVDRWRVESVEADPAALLDRWSVSSDGQARRLRLVLSSDASAEALDGASFVVRARRPARHPAKPLPFATLEVVRPLGPELVSDRWEVAAPDFRAITPVRVPFNRVTPPDESAPPTNAPPTAAAPTEPTGPPPASPATLAWRRRVRSGATRIGFDLSGARLQQRRAWGVRVDDRRAPLTASLSLSADQEANGIAYRMSADFGARRSASEPIDIRFDSPLPANASWTERETGRPLNAEPRDGGRWWRVPPTEGATWSGLAVEALLPPVPNQPLPLAVVAAATASPASVKIGPRLASRGWVDFQTNLVTRLTNQAAPGGLAFRYDPAELLVPSRPDQDQTPASSMLVWRRHAAEPAASNGLLSTLGVRYNAAGLARHTAEYAQLAPGAPFRFRLPSEAAFLDATAADGTVLPTQRAAGGERLIEAASIDGANAVRIRYTTQADPLRHGEWIAPVPPERPGPPGAFLWRVDLPPGHRFVSPSAAPPALVDRLIGSRGAAVWRGGFFEQTPLDEEWRTTELLIVGAAPPGAWVDHPTTRKRRLVIALAIAVVVGALLFERRRLLWLLGAALALAAVLTLPPGVVETATAAWIGWLLAAPLAIVVDRLASRAQRVAPPKPANVEATGSTVSQPKAWLLVAGIALTPAGAAAQPTAPAPLVTPSLAPSAAPEMLFTPVDAQGKPVGDKAYLRESWLRRLLTADARRRRPEPSDALLRSMDCRGVFRRSELGALQPGSWTLLIDLSTFARATRVTLPLRRSDADWLPNAQVDGQPRPIEWDPSGFGCSFVVDEPGDARARIRFTPTAQITDAESCLRLALPPINDARLAITFPTDHRDLRTPFLPTRVTRTEDAARLETPLAANAELLVCWTDEPRRGPLRPAELDVMQWLWVSPRGAYLEVKGVATETAAAADWKFLTPPGCQPIQPTRPDASQAATPFARNASSSTTTTATPRGTLFRLPRSSVEGRLRPPLVEVAGASIRSRSLALSVDEEYDWSLQAGGDTRSLDEEDFLDRWGPRGILPEIDRAMLVDGDAGPVLAIRKQEQDSTVSQQMTLTVDRDGTACRYTAQYDAGAISSAGQRVFRVPASMRIQDARVEAGGDQTLNNRVDSRWTRPRADRLVLFHDAPPWLEEGFRVVIQGETPAPPTPDRSTPLLFDSSTSKPVAVTLAAADRVRVEPVGSDWRAAPPTAAATSVPAATPIASAPLSPKQPPLRYRVTNNRPRVDLTSFTTFERDRGAVVATWEVRGRVTAGELRRLPIAAPAGPAPKLVVSPADGPSAVEGTIEPVDDVREADYWFVFPQRLGAGTEFRFRLSTKLPLTPRGVLPATPMRVVGRLASTKQAVALPAARDDAQGRWNWSGLRPTPPPAWADSPGRLRFLKPLIGASPSVCWSVAPERAAIGPTAPLASHRVAVSPDGAATIFSTLLVPPGGSPYCRVRLPAEGRLISATVDGRWTPTRRVAPDTWELLLGNADAPGVVKLCCAATVDGPIVTPTRLGADGEPIPAEQTLYEIGLADHSTSAGPVGATRLTIQQLNAARRHAEAEHGLPPQTLEDQAFDAWAPAAAHRFGLLVEGPHQPPALRPTGRVTAVLRYATAMLVVGAAGAVVFRKRRTTRHPEP